MLSQFSAQAFIFQPSSFSHSDLGLNPLHRMKPFSMSMVSSSSSEKVFQTPSTKKRRRSRTKSSSSGSNVNNRSSQPKSRRKEPQPQQQKQKSKIPVNEAKTMGEAIQLAETISDHLFTAEKFVWLPTDDDLQPHLRTQMIHHEKRRRWGSQLLEGLGQAALSSWENNNPMEFKLEGEEGGIWSDGRLVRAIMSAALPMAVDNAEEATMNRPEKEGVWIAAALKGLHVLSGCISPMAPSSVSSLLEMQSWMDLHRGISSLIQSADRLSERTSLKDAIEVRWAIRGLVVRLQMANSALSNVDTTLDETPIIFNDESILDFTTPNLNARTSNLPFDILSHCLPWQMGPSTQSNYYYGYPTQDLMPTLLQSIPFNFDTLTTRTGDSVIERRGTAWLAEEGIGALAYSGKLMRPAEVPEAVREAMREMEHWCVDQGQRKSSSQIVDLSNDSSSNSFVELKWDNCASNLPYDELGQFLQQDSNGIPSFFDCALCNHYPDGDSACKFHTDPEHGTHWHRTTAVVSCGTSRGFAFRPIPEVSTWSEWDTIDQNTQTKETQQNDNTPASLQLFPGDVVFMTGSCNDFFHHAVYSSPFDRVGIENSRVSLVFKRALDRGGKKGHGLAGEGRRSRQRNRRQ
eukprot:CAMPEP_0172307882 /NCGR_PEP_ID=MMETSP1058-20130122/8645_1 /TAXON_ID=83371 /ORGANISM="Detonula confervacea, Strain CCMP 353" /LENGTH=630 /DNA_ID=CAMNT_0013020179 /DNA_START=107 /DNA_END=1999 /DNA_ORIENTATION=+